MHSNDQRRTVDDQAFFDQLEELFMQALSGLRTSWSLDCDLGVLLPLWIAWIGPRVPVVQHIREGIELRLVSRPRYVHAVATRELLPWDNEVKFDTIHMGVRYPQAVKLVVLQSSESQLLKELHYFALLLISWSVFACK
ncbi:hypothetical protein GCM10007385_20000 [Tateyamaria omphalii]|nr:hypothetical protein GCM10007385_20000 [Tateyamaria omphalii]